MLHLLRDQDIQWRLQMDEIELTKIFKLLLFLKYFLKS